MGFKTTERGPIYLKGFKPGVNWLKLELLNASGKPVANAFSETVRLITFNPNGKDTLSQLVRGELTAQEAERIVNRRVSKRLAEQEKAAQEDQEALAAEAAKDAAKPESAKTIAPAPEALIKKIPSAVDPSPVLVLPRSPSPTSPTSSNPKPAPSDQSLEKAEEAQVRDVPLWSKLKSSVFSKTASEAQPKVTRSFPSKTASPNVALPSAPLPDAPSLNVPKLNLEPLEPLQKFLDFQPLDPENLPVIQQKTAVEIPSRYLKQSQPLNQTLEPLSSEDKE
jgi:hypothetical protein